MQKIFTVVHTYVAISHYEITPLKGPVGRSEKFLLSF